MKGFYYFIIICMLFSCNSKKTHNRNYNTDVDKNSIVHYAQEKHLQNVK